MYSTQLSQPGLNPGPRSSIFSLTSGPESFAAFCTLLQICFFLFLFPLVVLCCAVLYSLLRDSPRQGSASRESIPGIPICCCCC